MLKKFLIMLLILNLVLSTNISVFATEVNNNANFVTRNEYEEKLSNLEKKLDELKSNYNSNINKAIIEFFKSEKVNIFKLEKGVTSNTSNFKTNRWQLKSNGNAYEVLKGTLTRKDLLDYVTEYNTYKYFIAQLTQEEAPLGKSAEVLAKVSKMQINGQIHGTIEALIRTDDPLVCYTTWSPDNGQNWDKWETGFEVSMSSQIPTCETASNEPVKVITSNVTGWKNGSVIHVNFKYYNTANNPSLKINDGPEIPIYWGNEKVVCESTANASQTWDAESRVTFILENPGNQYEPSTDCKWHILHSTNGLGRVLLHTNSVNSMAQYGSFSFSENIEKFSTILFVFKEYCYFGVSSSTYGTMIFDVDDIIEGKITKWKYYQGYYSYRNFDGSLGGTISPTGYTYDSSASTTSGYCYPKLIDVYGVYGSII